MFDWNDYVTFTRKSSFLVQAWASGTPIIVNPNEPAYLEVAASGVTVGTLTVLGTDEDDGVISEVFSFTVSATSISNNKFKSITTLTPSWSSYTINIKATDIQGTPIMAETSFGPYLCSVTTADSFTPDGDLGIPGQLKGRVWRVSVLDFEPEDGDLVLTGNGLSGTVTNTAPYLFPNFPTGWNFFLEENPG